MAANGQTFCDLEGHTITVFTDENVSWLVTMSLKVIILSILLFQITPEISGPFFASLCLDSNVDLKVEAFGPHPFRFRILIVGSLETQLIAQARIYRKIVETWGIPTGIAFYQNLDT